ncbi:hypothetical protein [Sagittula stellata]|uniref:Uncharacterized protein n=2 Tax=Sagittula stellata TaxID=52603 RepID=A3KA86_SAGS3|nr:hypothetical protein SSE37_15673 [Sagittula stellata E-37]
MLEAVAKRKAHWLLRAGSSERYTGGKRPQEDLVTSAVFGSIRLMPLDAQRPALSTLLGEKVIDDHLPGTGQIKIDLWPRFHKVGRIYVEPDVVLTCDARCLVVEVKWHAVLGKDQLEDQVLSVDPKASAVVLLGENDQRDAVHGVPLFPRSWRSVAESCGRAARETSQISSWANTIAEFLKQTDVGAVFTGIPEPILHAPYLTEYYFSPRNSTDDPNH